MSPMLPGARLGVGRRLFATANVHFYDIAPGGAIASFCGQGFSRTAVQIVFVHSKRAFVLAQRVVPVAGNIACAACAEIYRARVVE